MKFGGVRRIRGAVLGLLVFALALAACGGGDDGARAQVKRPATTAPPTTTTTVPPTTTTTVPAYMSSIATVPLPGLMARISSHDRADQWCTKFYGMRSTASKPLIRACLGCKRSRVQIPAARPNTS